MRTVWPARGAEYRERGLKGWRTAEYTGGMPARQVGNWRRNALGFLYDTGCIVLAVRATGKGRHFLSSAMRGRSMLQRGTPRRITQRPPECVAAITGSATEWRELPGGLRESYQLTAAERGSDVRHVVFELTVSVNRSELDEGLLAERRKD